MPDFEAYLVATAQGDIEPFTSRPHIEQARPVLQALLALSGAPAKRIQEIHWHGGDEEFWLSGLGQSDDFSPSLARFHWPVTALLPHVILQSAGRALESGDRDLVILAQETAGTLITLLLASPAAVGRHNLTPRARLSTKLTFSSTPDGPLPAALTALEKSGQAASEIAWLGASRRFNGAQQAFPAARWVGLGPQTPAGDLFVFAALVDCLVTEKSAAGLLVSEGPQKSGLATLVERV
ncbi:MAG TPA: hypothetical protein VF806_04935 [Anaerolineaceae bacterium]